MEIRTFTNFWNQEKKLYSINDIPLPFPIPLRSLLVFFLVAIPWLILMIAILHVPLVNGFSLVIYFGPPGLIAWLGSKPILENKSLLQFLRSQISYWMTEAKHWKGLVPNTEGTSKTYQTRYRIYRRDRGRR